MGEYATYNGSEIKIGTCEDCYYLRADQRHLISGYDFDQDTLDAFRFRFPFPDEDTIEPGQFQDHDRGIYLSGVQVPEGVEHYSVQFIARPAGYLTSLPCPEDTCNQIEGVRIGRNGFRGTVKIVQQAYRNGNLALILACGGCDARYNCPTIHEAEPVIGALIHEAELAKHDELRRAEHYGEDPNPNAGSFYIEIARRITRGYTLAATAA